MKRNFFLLLIALLALPAHAQSTAQPAPLPSASPNPAASGCTASTPASVMMAVNYVSLVQRGGISLTDPPDPNGPTPEMLCSQMQSYLVANAPDHPDYLDVLLKLSGQNCIVSMKPMENGKFDDVNLMGCREILPPCIKDPDDPFAITARISTGPYEGQCIDTVKYRSTTRLTLDQLQSFLTSDEISKLSQQGIDIHGPGLEFVANFTDAAPEGPEQFYVAIIPLERIQSATVQLTQLVEYLPIRHGQLRLNLSKTGRPVVLFDQTKNPNRAMKFLTGDIVMSVSGVRPVGNTDPFNAFKGLEPGYYNTEFQIGSLQDLDLNWIISEGYQSDEYRLNITADQARKALSAAITLATKNGVDYPYSTLTSSCLNVTFEILDEATGASDNGALRPVAQSIAPETSLEAAGLINSDGSSYIDTLP